MDHDLNEADLQTLRSLVSSAMQREVMADRQNGSGDIQYLRELTKIETKLIVLIQEAGR